MGLHETTLSDSPHRGRQPQRLNSSQLTVGEIIATYRQRRVRECNGEPWSQEELAFASGTNQAHISRIESNRKHPQYSTLLRLCEALDIPAAKRSYLLALAGYRVEPALPGKAAVDAVLSELAPVIDRYPYPALLMDVGERIWYVNVLVSAMWGPCLGGNTHSKCLMSVRGKRSVEFLFDARFMPVWISRLQDPGPVMDRHVFLFWRAYHLHSQEAEMKAALETLKSNREFLWRWHHLEDGQMKTALVEHDSLPLTHPDFSKIVFGIWRTTVAADERFIVAHFPPADEVTQLAIGRYLCR
ncbi:MAG TPA: helix-turn-helix transcriptional regulator [Bryobacteraceae bacterium]|nr:helix-turn-helix transcriptional regulator [Bryobacteraceae bacterium]